MTMRRLWAILGSFLFLCAAPGIVAGLIPWWISGWERASPLFAYAPVLGAGLIAVGAVGLLDSFGRFAIGGLGTPAPLFPTRRLVVTGLYRWVRNPMYVAVAALIFGQGLYFGDIRLLGYGFLAWCACHLFVLLNEEPTLRRRFPDDYPAYCAAVPRWWPRLTPWRG